ncbi:MAG: Xylose isomerase protein barrel, partial [Verrucomicrobiales bacterium]|nr:Xylose isomerase protein barrel [Verrucomicrobiales bacterium]
MKLGISSYTFGWAIGVPGFEPRHPLDEHGLLDFALKHDIKVLQIGDNLPLHTFDAARLKRFAQRAKQDQVQLEVGARRLNLERVALYAEIARRLNAQLLRFVVDDADYHPEPKAISTILRESLPLLDGLTLGLENHDRFSAETLRGIIESAKSERIGICLDTANSLGAGEGFEHVLRTLAPLTVNLHIKDFQIERLPHKMGFTITGRPAGSGFLKVPELLKELAPFKRCSTAILELWTPPEPQLHET